MGGNARSWMLGAGLIVWLLFGAGLAQAQAAEGVVFFDDNGNGAVDPGEAGVANVAISDGTTVVRTDATGSFQLAMDSAARFVFATIPSGARATEAWYLPVNHQATCMFPLERVDAEGALVFVQLSDIHYAPTPEEFKEGLRDRRMVILPDPVLDAITSDVNAFDVDFVVLAGDIVADARYPEPAMVERWMAAMAEDFAPGFRAPVYGVIGNHDIVRDESIGKAFYETHFGPTYYSFDVKGTHCVVLDTQQLVGTGLVYSVDARQLAWLEQDLAHVASNAPILVFCHEPTPDWAATEENEALFDLLAGQSIAALINGHWHTNAVLREEPFYEVTSGAVCGAWWEGPGPDGTGFGYRVFRLGRGNLDSMWRTGGEARIDVPSPARAILTWVDRLQAHVWGQAEQASYRWGDGPAVSVDVFWNGLWSSVSANLNVSTLDDGYQDLSIDFSMADGTTLEETRTYNVSNPAISLAEIFDHAATYQGKLVAAPDLKVRAVMGSDISAFDETKTIIISPFPYSVARNDLIGIVGMYRPTGAAPIKGYDEIFFTVYAE